RHGHYRSDRSFRARPPVADILEIPYRPRLPGHKCDELADVEPAATAKGDHAVMPAGLEDIHTPMQVRLDWVRAHIGKNAWRKPRCSQKIERLLRDVELRETGVGDEQRLPDPGSLAGVRQLVDAARAETDGGRIAPVRSELCHFTSLR